jgi:Ca2+-binding EF-hand superfamily protein
LLPQSELQSLMAIADVDGDGLIDYNEFVAATMHLSKLNKEELLQRVRRCSCTCNLTCNLLQAVWP